MPEHDRDPVTTARRPRRRAGRGGGAGGGARAQQAVQLMYATTYLMNAPGTQQLLHWGGHEARELAGATVGLVTDQLRLAEAADAWHAAAGDLHTAAGELTGYATGLDGWESGAAEAFRGEHRARVERLAGLADTYRGVGETMADAAEQLGRVHGALLAATHAAGESVRLLGAGATPGESPGTAAEGAARAVVGGWLTGGRALLDAWTAHADHCATTLATLHTHRGDHREIPPS
jgi:hypothetical protein